MKSNRIIFIVFILLLLASGIIFNAPKPVIFSVLIIVVAILSLIISFIRTLYLKVKVEVSEIGNKSQDIHGRIIVEGRKISPPRDNTYVVKATNILTGDTENIEYSETAVKTENKLITKRYEIPVTFSSKYCGAINLSVENIVVRDIFNVFKIKVKCNESSVVRVNPDTFFADIKLNDIANNETAEGEMLKALRPNRTGEVIDIREYHNGDSMKDIHWKLTGKYDMPMVKKKADLISRKVIVFLENCETFDKNKAVIIDGMVQVFMSVSQSLTDMGIEHTIAWYNHEKNETEVYEIQSGEDISGVLQKVLFVQFKKEKENILDYFQEDYSRQNYSHYIYISKDNYRQFQVPACDL